jgi:APA family basic amino acid/polyamine antiporter
MKKDMEAGPKLQAKLNIFDATLLVVGSVIGSGIFLTTGIIAQSLPSPFMILFVWVVGAVLCLFGGLTLAELGAMMPDAGGQYIYLREAYGKPAAFLYGWTTFLVLQTGGIAALAVGFAEYLSYFMPALGLNKIIIGPFSYGQLVAVISILILTMINYYGVKTGSTVQNFFTILKLVAILVLVVAGFFFAGSDKQVLDQSGSMELPAGMALFSAIGVAFIAVLWTFDGWYAVNTVASEIKNPGRNIPWSLITGLSLIGIVYLLINMFYISVLPIPEMAGVVRIGEEATTAAFGRNAGAFMNGLIVISILGCLSATILFGPRVYYAMADDGIFFRSFARVHPRYHTPGNAIIWQGIWSSLLCLTGTYEELFTYVTFTVVVFFIAATLAIFRLRKTRPEAYRPYKTWGYPVIPAVFGFAMLLIAGNSLSEKPVESFLGLLIMLAGLPIYYYWAKKAAD